MMSKQLYWIADPARYELIARIKVTAAFAPGGYYVTIPSETLLKQLGKWCVDNSCGRRHSRTYFQFDTAAEQTMFLLAWADYNA